MRLHRSGSTRSQTPRARFAGVALAALGAVGLGLTVAPACGGDGSTGDNVVHLDGSAAHVAVAVVGDSVAPDCGGGGGAGSDD
jgi:hypothetical protein